MVAGNDVGAERGSEAALGGISADLSPRAAFPGRIEVVTSAARLAEALEYLHSVRMVGFDTETRPAFRRGEQHALSLVQLATDEVAWLVRMPRLEEITPLAAFFADELVVKVGLSLPDDLRALQGVGIKQVASLVDLQPLARRAGLREQSLRAITGAIFGEYVSKSARLTNWDAEELSPRQLMYAATDAWLCYRLAQHERFRSMIGSERM